MYKKILIVDDENPIIKSLTDILEDEGYEAIASADGETALKLVSQEAPDLLLLDIWLPGMDGIEVLKKIKSDCPFLPVIMMSGHGTIDTAVKATKLGAYDFLEKPLSYEQVILSIANALKYRELQEENILLKQKASGGDRLIGESPVMQTLKEQIRIIAPTDAWVLITGENGTGKELVARMIHRLSKRKDKPFIDVNCAAIPEELIESELFGHEKGAFTGAMFMKKGKFDLANGGTLFLDEIGDMSLKTQAKILRILQEQKFERVGGTRTISVDVRIIAATNKNLEEEIKKGDFREDLYFRLNVIPLHVPPLRERKEDIILLFKEFIEEFSRTMAMKPGEIRKEIANALMVYNWPGNVRELRNLAERLVILGMGQEITLEDLPKAFRKKKDITDTKYSTQSSWLEIINYRKAKDAFDREFLIRRLEENHGNVKKTAEAIGIERRHLYRKLKALDIHF